MSNTFDDLYQLFYVAAYGCNRRCEREIKKVVFAHRQETPFLFYEFFLTQPIPARAVIDNSVLEDSKKDVKDRKWTDWDKRIFVVAPFAPRMVEHSVVVPTTNKHGKAELVFRDKTSFQQLRLAFRWDYSTLAHSCWTHWSACLPQTHNDKYKPARGNGPDLWWPHVEDITSNVNHCVGFVNRWSMKWQRDVYPKKMKDEPFSKANALALAQLYSPLFLGNEGKEVPGLFVPIASSQLFYGGIWIMLPGHNPGPRECLRKEVGLRLAQLVDKTYLPVLIVLHEHWLEKLHKDHWDDSKSRLPSDHVFTIPVIPDSAGDKKVPTRTSTSAARPPVSEGIEVVPGNESNPRAHFRNIFLSLDVQRNRARARHGVESIDALEELMCNLWKRRGVKKPWEKGTPFEDSLIFEKYLICSEQMAKLLCRVVASSRTLNKAGKTLPACLVVGGAGSGKEDLARMLRLFSSDRLNRNKKKKIPGYYAGQEYVVNLSAIRPAPLTAAIMTGLDVNGTYNAGIKDATNASPTQIQGTYNAEIKGILQRIRKESEKMAPPTLRLDEFNSMDPDSQGVLLRFLDNSEIIPVGGADDPGRDGTDCLVVGIMNEDPEDISRERAMEYFKKGEYLGKFVGDLLYEHFMHIRRLRPDVMYRMIRNGKFVIPELRERREDIPLLFQVFMKKELKALLEDSPRLHISLDVLHRLIQPDLRWPGNVRQLQALAKVVAERVFAEQRGGGEWYVVTAPVLENGLQEVGLLEHSE